MPMIYDVRSPPLPQKSHHRSLLHHRSVCHHPNAPREQRALVEACLKQFDAGVRSDASGETAGSVLTRILGEGVGGDCKTFVLVNLSTAEHDRTHTVGAIMFLELARHILNTPSNKNNVALSDSPASWGLRTSISEGMATQRNVPSLQSSVQEQVSSMRSSYGNPAQGFSSTLQEPDGHGSFDGVGTSAIHDETSFVNSHVLTSAVEEATKARQQLANFRNNATRQELTLQTQVRGSAARIDQLERALRVAVEEIKSEKEKARRAIQMNAQKKADAEQEIVSQQIALEWERQNARKFQTLIESKSEAELMKALNEQTKLRTTMETRLTEFAKQAEDELRELQARCDEAIDIKHNTVAEYAEKLVQVRHTHGESLEAARERAAEDLANVTTAHNHSMDVERKRGQELVKDEREDFQKQRERLQTQSVNERERLVTMMEDRIKTVNDEKVAVTRSLQVAEAALQDLRREMTDRLRDLQKDLDEKHTAKYTATKNELDAEVAAQSTRIVELEREVGQLRGQTESQADQLAQRRAKIEQLSQDFESASGRATTAEDAHQQVEELLVATWSGNNKASSRGGGEERLWPRGRADPGSRLAGATFPSLGASSRAVGGGAGVAAEDRLWPRSPSATGQGGPDRGRLVKTAPMAMAAAAAAASPAETTLSETSPALAARPMNVADLSSPGGRQQVGGGGDNRNLMALNSIPRRTRLDQAASRPPFVGKTPGYGQYDGQQQQR